jgi:hypothetical protein
MANVVALQAGGSVHERLTFLRFRKRISPMGCRQSGARLLQQQGCAMIRPHHRAWPPLEVGRRLACHFFPGDCFLAIFFALTYSPADVSHGAGLALICVKL